MTLLPKGTKVRFTDPGPYDAVSAIVLGEGDDDFDTYDVGSFDYLLKQDDVDSFFSIRRAYASEVEAI